AVQRNLEGQTSPAVREGGRELIGPFAIAGPPARGVVVTPEIVFPERSAVRAWFSQQSRVTEPQRASRTENTGPIPGVRAELYACNRGGLGEAHDGISVLVVLPVPPGAAREHGTCRVSPWIVTNALPERRHLGDQPRTARDRPVARTCDVRARLLDIHE